MRGVFSAKTALFLRLLHLSAHGSYLCSASTKVFFLSLPLPIVQWKWNIHNLWYFGCTRHFLLHSSTTKLHEHTFFISRFKKMKLFIAFPISAPLQHIYLHVSLLHFH